MRRKGARRDKPLAADDPNIVAIATDHESVDEGVPVFGLDDIDAIADFIVAYSKLPVRGDG